MNFQYQDLLLPKIHNDRPPSHHAHSSYSELQQSGQPYGSHSPYAGTAPRPDFSESQMTLELAKDQRDQDISLRSVDDINAELNSVSQMRRMALAQIQSAKTALSSLTGLHGSGKQIVHIEEYLKGIGVEKQLNRMISDLKEEKRRVLNPRVTQIDEMIDAYTVPCTRLAIAGGGGFTLTFGLIFYGLRGQMELARWSSLIFVIGFTHSGFLQATMQFPYVRKQIPMAFARALPYFLLWIFLCYVAAVVLLYVEVMALDLGPELYHDKTPVLVPKPYISAVGNRIPGYIIAMGALVIGIPWFMALSRKIRTALKPIGGNSS